MSEQWIDPVLVEKIAAALKARSGGHFEAVRDQADEKFRGDAEAVIDELGLKEERQGRGGDLIGHRVDYPSPLADEYVRYRSDWRPVEQGHADGD